MARKDGQIIQLFHQDSHAWKASDLGDYPLGGWASLATSFCVTCPSSRFERSR